jgi:predicted peptidase
MKAITTAALAAFLVLVAESGAGSDPLQYSGEFEKRTFTGSSGKELHYRLLKPKDYHPAATTAYPLVIFLHGIGERGVDNEAQLLHGVREFAKPETRAKHPCFVVAPQCPPNTAWSAIERKGFNITVKFPKEPSEQENLIIGLLDSLPKEFHIDPKRVYITGLSMGGFGTWDLLARYHDRFAAGIPVCGGGYEPAVPEFAKVPLWVFHGGADPLVKPQFSRSMVDAIHKAGGKPGFTEYPGVGHDCWTMTYHNPDVLDWLFAQKKE